MRRFSRLVILLAPVLTSCESLNRMAHERDSPDGAPVQHPIIDQFLHGRPSLAEERAVDQPLIDAYRRRDQRFGDYTKYPW